jgi:hypothetical protein
MLLIFEKTSVKPKAKRGKRGRKRKKNLIRARLLRHHVHVSNHLEDDFGSFPKLFKESGVYHSLTRELHVPTTIGF